MLDVAEQKNFLIIKVITKQVSCEREINILCLKVNGRNEQI